MHRWTIQFAMEPSIGTFRLRAELRNVAEKGHRQISSLDAVRLMILIGVLGLLQTHEDGVEAFHDNGS